MNYSLKEEELREKYRASLSFAAIGDALGWPVEYGHKKSVDDFVEWKKFVGGRFWGYQQEIEKGMYSDDMQLSLSVARSIDSSGKFDPGFFGYLELPLWLSYEQGGGRATKTAAHALAEGSNWEANFYYRKGQKNSAPVSYVQAGGNGVAMRILPNILTSWDSRDGLIRDVFNNGITTHGHLRAIYGAFLYAFAAKYILESHVFSPNDFFNYVGQQIRDVCLYEFLPRLNSELYIPWIIRWEDISQISFDMAEKKVVSEILLLLEEIQSLLEEEDQFFFETIGALNPSTRGSGTITSSVAIYMFIKYLENPIQGLFSVVNMSGSDTDTNANIACSLWGLFHGWNHINDELNHLHSQLQDREYLIEVADDLLAKFLGIKNFFIEKDIDKEEALMRVLAWEIGLHDMFWDALDVGKRIMHPVLGSGRICDKTVKDLKRKGYSAKLIRVHFETGQSCWFHSRINLDGEVVNSLHKELRKALKDSELMRMKIFERIENLTGAE